MLIGIVSRCPHMCTRLHNVLPFVLQATRVSQAPVQAFVSGKQQYGLARNVLRRASVHDQEEASVIRDDGTCIVHLYAVLRVLFVNMHHKRA